MMCRRDGAEWQGKDGGVSIGTEEGEAENENKDGAQNERQAFTVGNDSSTSAPVAGGCVREAVGLRSRRCIDGWQPMQVKARAAE
jgi:hypothetical protein